MVLIRICILGLLLRVATYSSASSADPDVFIIRNVIIIEPGSPSDLTVVNIQVIDGKVAAVTEDKIQAPTGAHVSNARRGYLLGDIEVGEPPRFIILDKDPLKNFGVMQDTRSHTKFVMEGSRITTDNLDTKVVVAPTRPVSRRWISYNPPPIVIPLSVDFNKKWNAFEGEYVSTLFSAGIFLDRAFWWSQNQASKSQLGVGNIKDYEGGNIRAIRAGLNGEIRFKRSWVARSHRRGSEASDWGGMSSARPHNPALLLVPALFTLEEPQVAQRAGWKHHAPPRLRDQAGLPSTGPA